MTAVESAYLIQVTGSGITGAASMFEVWQNEIGRDGIDGTACSPYLLIQYVLNGTPCTKVSTKAHRLHWHVSVELQLIQKGPLF